MTEKARDVIFNSCLDIARHANLILDDAEHEESGLIEMKAAINKKLIEISNAVLKIKIILSKLE